MLPIIRGLWGNALLARRSVRPPEAFAHVLKSIVRLKERDDQTDVFYCFGEDNRDFLQYLGFKDVRMLNSKSWASPKIVQSFHHRWDGAWIHGCSYWWHKLLIICQALKDFDDVLWLDGDVHQLKPITPEVAQSFRNGQGFKAALYLQRNWSWGAGWRRSARWGVSWFCPLEMPDATRAAQTVPGCGLIYIRSKEIAREWFCIQAEKPFWLDHQIVAYWLDRRYGRWIGDEEYIKEGYHTDHWFYGRMLYPPQRKRIVWQSGDWTKRTPS